MAGLLKRFYHSMGESVNKPYAEPLLGFLFFIEAIFFIPTDPILIFFCFEKRERSLWYATIATISSVLGGLGGYALGALLWHYWGDQIIHNSIVNVVLTPETFQCLSNQYEQYAWYAIMTAGFTPVPYKAATLTAGFCKISLYPFIIGSLISRGARFFLYAFIIRAYGPQIKDSISRYFNIVMMVSLALIALIIWLCYR